MRLEQTLETRDAINGHMLDMFIPQDLLNEADKVEIWCSDFKDAGADCNVFKLFKAGAAEPFCSRTVDGY